MAANVQRPVNKRNYDYCAALRYSDIELADVGANVEHHRNVARILDLEREFQHDDKTVVSLFALLQRSTEPFDLRNRGVVQPILTNLSLRLSREGGDLQLQRLLPVGAYAAGNLVGVERVNEMNKFYANALGRDSIKITRDRITCASRERIPVSISTTEILIILDNQLETNGDILNATLYGIADANVVSRSGIWTLSESYLAPRIFRKVSSYDDMVHEYDRIDLEGREVQVSTFYRPPVSYLRTTVNRTIDGEEVEIFLADDVHERDGIETNIFLLLAETLNFTWTMRKPTGRYKYGIRYNETAWSGGVIQLLNDKKIDMAFASIWLSANNNLFVNLTEPWYELFIHFLVPRPRPTTSFWALTRPFTVDAWALLILMLLSNSLYLFVGSWINPRFPARFRHFVITLTELTGRLLGTWVPRNVANVRLQLHLWQVAGVVIVTAYSSSLAARLASSEYEARIDTVKQFVEAGLTWGRIGAEPSYSDYFDLDDTFASQLPGRLRPVANDEETHANIQRGKYAIIGRFMGSVFFPEDDVLNEDLKGYRLMKETVGNYYVAFAVQPWLLRPVNKIMLALRQTGITFFHLRDVIRRRASFNLREVLVEHDTHDEGARVLSLMPLGAGFSMLLAGLIVSTIVFYLELRRVRGSRSILQVLRDIETKRKSSKMNATLKNPVGNFQRDRVGKYGKHFHDLFRSGEFIAERRRVA